MTDCECPYETDQDKRNHPHDRWCDECQMSTCKDCFEPHLKHEFSGAKVAQIMNKINTDPENNKSEIVKVRNENVKKEIEAIVTSRSKGISHPL